MKKLNILILNALDIYGGGEFFVNQLSKKLKELGHNVWVSCRKDNLIFENCLKNKINIYPLEYPKNKNTNLLQNARLLSKFIKERRIEIIHSNTNYDRTCGAIASLITGSVHVASIHSLQSIQHNITHWIRNVYYIKHFIVNGKNTKELLIKKDKINEDKISLIYMGLNPEEYKLNILEREKIRNKFGINKDEVIIGNMARMVPFKGHDLLIKSFNIINKSLNNVKLMIVGDGERRKYLEELVKENKLENKIIFTGFKKNFKEYYSAFDIYAHTPHEGGGESFPYAVLYALAYKLPIITTNVGDLPALATNNVNGFLINNNDIISLSKKMIQLCNNTELRNIFGKASLELLKNNFTEIEMVKNIEKVYIKAIRNSKLRD